MKNLKEKFRFRINLKSNLFAGDYDTFLRKCSNNTAQAEKSVIIASKCFFQTMQNHFYRVFHGNGTLKIYDLLIRVRYIHYNFFLCDRLSPMFSALDG